MDTPQGPHTETPVPEQPTIESVQQDASEIPQFDPPSLERGRKKHFWQGPMSPWRRAAIIIGIILAACGLIFVGLIVLFVVALSSYGSNK
ncbi:MAG: hypothetical protein WDN27_05280 [Candidatus Saccharibacteria bacterium]